MNTLFVAWRSGGPDNGAWGPVGRLDYDGCIYRFCYTHGAGTLSGFKPFAQMNDLNQVYESDTLFPLFANRLLSPSRPEYEAFLCWGGFDPDNPPNPIVILGVTEGIRQTDAIEVFPCPVPDTEGCYINRFFLHGIRWMTPEAIDRIGHLQPEEELILLSDPNNPVDRNAIAIYTATNTIQIGFAPRYLASDVKKLLDDCIPDAVQLTVERLNNGAPLQNRVLCRMHACWPPGFSPCSDQEFQPIPLGVANLV